MNNEVNGYLVAAGGSAGALLSAPCADFLGRKWSMMIYGLLYLLGCAFQEIPNLKILYAGRFLAGVAVGSMSAGAPQFLAENSPKAIRGSMTCLYNLMIIMSLSLAFWINYAVSRWKNVNKTDNTPWQLALGYVPRWTHGQPILTPSQNPIDPRLSHGGPAPMGY